jgi:hypothetical protein
MPQIPNSPVLDTLFDAGVLCEVCQQRPWTQHAAHWDVRLCADCASHEPAPEED